VIVLKAGRTEAGKKVVSSHTASMAGNDEINSAAFRQSGVIRAGDLSGFLAGHIFIVGDRQVHLRLLTRHDIDLWTEFVNSCSLQSLWMRFLSPFSPTPEAAQRFCDTDPDEEVAVVAETNEGDRQKLVAIARLIRCGQTDEAEYAVIVTDSWQQKTLGRLLLEVCLDIAKRMNIRVVNAETIRENCPMIKVLNRCRFEMDAMERSMVLMSLALE
jgi:RimJ/RimL family protein N-acetyltransferase